MPEGIPTRPCAVEEVDAAGGCRFIRSENIVVLGAAGEGLIVDGHARIARGRAGFGQDYLLVGSFVVERRRFGELGEELGPRLDRRSSRKLAPRCSHALRL